MSTYWSRLGNATSQWFNALSGGSGDIPMSGKVGYLSYKNYGEWWYIVEWVINTTFYPVDGPNHCLRAYRSDMCEKVLIGNIYSFGALSVFTILGCTILAPIFWLGYGTGMLINGIRG